MRILFFSGLVPSSNGVGCGWITGLLSRLSNHKGIEIVYGYINPNLNANPNLRTEGNITYLAIVKSRGKLDKIRRYFNPAAEEPNIIRQMQQMIEEYQPDVIHVFGSETIFGLISAYTDVPVIIHLQGLMMPYVNSYFPNGYAESDLKTWNEKRAYKVNKYFAERERRIFESCKYYMGRTEWDERVSRLLSPESKYFKCEEMLRPEFYDVNLRYEDENEDENENKVRIVSVLSSPLYKGHDMILKTAHILKTVAKVDFEWTVLGYHSMEKAEKKFGMKASDNNIRLVGRKNVNELIEILKESDIFVHPSYIDNSPNSVCEAQYMGLPVIACNEGGVPSLMVHGESGLLIPCNDPYMAASYIQELTENPELYQGLSKGAIEVATKRHDPETIVNTLINIYNDIR